MAGEAIFSPCGSSLLALQTQAKKAAEEKGTVIQEEDDEDEENDQPKDAKAIAVKSVRLRASDFLHFPLLPSSESNLFFRP